MRSLLQYRKHLIYGLCAVVAVLIALSVFTFFVKRQFAPGQTWGIYGIAELFHLDSESNVPTWFSSSLLFACSVLLGCIALGKTASGGRFRVHWWILSAGFVFLSIDETAQIHEKFIRIVQMFGPTSGIFLFAWVIPALIALPILGLAYVRFLRHLPPRICTGFLISAGLYFSGAIGMEMVGGSYVSGGHSKTSVTYTLITHVEESLELFGIVFFLAALLEYLALPDPQRSRPGASRPVAHDAIPGMASSLPPDPSRRQWPLAADENCRAEAPSPDSAGCSPTDR